MSKGRSRSYAPNTEASFISGGQRRACVGRYRRSQPRVTRIIAAEMAMTPPNTASKPTPLTKTPGAKNNTTGIQPVTRPKLAAPVNRPTRMLSQRPRDPSPPKTAMMTATKNANQKTKNRAMYNTAKFWRPILRATGPARPHSKWQDAGILNQDCRRTTTKIRPTLRYRNSKAHGRCLNPHPAPPRPQGTKDRPAGRSDHAHRTTRVAIRLRAATTSSGSGPERVQAGRHCESPLR